MKTVLGFILLVLSFAANGQFITARETVYPVSTDVSIPALGGFGSAVVIKKGYLLTAAHVIPLAKEVDYVVKVRTKDGVKPMKTLKINRDADIALMSADIDCPCATIDDGQPTLDESIIMIGYPWTNLIKMQWVTDGRYQGINPNGLMGVSASAAPGNSGGGVFRKKGDQWVLIGIVSSIFSGNGTNSGFSYHTAFAVRLDVIRKFIAEAEKDGLLR